MHVNDFCQGHAIHILFCYSENTSKDSYNSIFKVLKLILDLFHVVWQETLPVKKEIVDRRCYDVYWENVALCQSVC